MVLSSQQLRKYNQQRPRSARRAICWAAEKSMYIGFRGNITSCCYNKTYLLGKYPDQSLHNIWFGSKRRDLDTQLKANNLNLGCHGCRELIAAGNFRALPAKNFDYLERSSNGYPTKVDFELSNECNLECIMCRGEFSSAIRKNRERLPAIPSPYNSEFVAEFGEFIPHIKRCHFLGGEPFMVPIYFDIWGKIIKDNPDVRISIQTNGSILTNRIKEMLEAVKFDISISIDSLRKGNYEFIRKNSNFDKLMHNIRYFKEYTSRQGTNLDFSVCPMPQNWQEVPALVQFANEMEASIFFNTVHYPQQYSFRSLDKGVLSEIVMGLKAYSFPTKNDKQRLNALAYDQLISNISYYKVESSFQEKSVDFDSYLQGLEQFIKQKNSASTESISFEEIREKLVYILTVAEVKDMRKQAESKIMEVSYKDLCDAVPGVDKNHLLHLFRSFMLPLP